PKYYESFMKEIDKLSPELYRIALNILTPEIWALNKMDLKTKILCAFSALAALGRTETEVFAYGAFYHGITIEQLTEIILVVGIEAGFPAAMEAFKRANIALERYNEIKKKE
ncbi:unnamed protein product, partial [marine sediment metagenome]